jgi:succinyl-diaminopimelate desuccinylase
MMTAGETAALARAYSWIASTVEVAVVDLGRMIALDTSFPPGRGYGNFAMLMETMTRPLEFEAERIEVPEELWRVPNGPADGARTNLVATRRSGKPACGLYFHVDTIPAAPG